VREEDPVRNVVLQEFVTLNGLATGPNDSVDFIPASTSGDQSFGREQLAFFDAIDTIVLGRVTYRMFAGYWPNVTEGDEKPFADKMNSTPKIVFSRGLEKAPWGKWDDARIVRTRAADEVAKLKAQPGKNIVICGSISLAITDPREADRRVSTGRLSSGAGERTASLQRRPPGDGDETARRQTSGSRSSVSEVHPRQHWPGTDVPAVI
jgi:dihydrofolate reductase